MKQALMKRLTGKQILGWSLPLTAAIEVVTVIFRFGLKLESSRDTASTVGVFTCGVRIHHGYVGVLAIVIALLCLRVRPVLSRWMLVLGTALVFGDLIHHFVVLWIAAGSPEFHLVYPSGWGTRAAGLVPALTPAPG